MSYDRPVLGVLLMRGFCILAPIADAIAKVLGENVPLARIVFVGFALQMAILGPLIAMTGRIWRMRGRVLRLTVPRTVLHIIGIAATVTALQYLPLAVAIAFAMPFIMLLLGKFVLGEEVGARRPIACIVGFGGTSMVVQTSFVQVGWPTLLPPIVAIVFSLFHADRPSDSQRNRPDRPPGGQRSHGLRGLSAGDLAGGVV